MQIFIKQSWAFIATRRFKRNSPFINRFFEKNFEKIKIKVVFANVSKKKTLRN